MTTIDRPATGATTRASRGRRLLALVAATAVVVTAVVWAMSRSDDDRTLIERMQDLAAAMRDNDADEVRSMLITDEIHTNEILWLTALRAEPTLTNCAEYGPQADIVRRELTSGDDFFYSRLLGETLTTRFAGGLDGDLIIAEMLDLPDEAIAGRVVNVELEFTSWAEEVHPELVEDMGLDSSDRLANYADESVARYVLYRVAFDHEAGEARMQLLDEFVASR